MPKSDGIEVLQFSKIKPETPVVIFLDMGS